MKSAIILGVGPVRGLGAQLALRFAKLGLHIVVAGRTRENLDYVVADIKNHGGSAEYFICDASREQQVINLFESTSDPIDLAIYNVGNNTPGSIIDMESSYFENSWRVGCFGGFLFGREAIRHMQPNKSGSVFFTGASASLRGRANFSAFNSAKGGLRNFAQAMAKECSPMGIHVGHIIIDGIIDGDKIRNRLSLIHI